MNYATVRETIYNELIELMNNYIKLFVILKNNPNSTSAAQNVELVRALIYEVAELAEKLGYKVELVWDDTQNYYRQLHGFVIR